MDHHHETMRRDRRTMGRPARRQSRPTGSDVMNVLEGFSATIGDATDLIRRTLERPERAQPSRTRRRRPQRDKWSDACGDGCCGECRTCDCMCTCCVCDADLVVYARLGEMRVVPIRLTNERRREREIELDLGPFSTRGGSDTFVNGKVVGPDKFTLEPCSERDIIIAINLADHADSKDDADIADRTKAELLAEARERGVEVTESARKAELIEALRDPDRQRLPDVDECHVATSDLRIVGCDVRPIAIAVAVLPRICGPYEVGCGCGCC